MADEKIITSVEDVPEETLKNLSNNKEEGK